MKKVGHKCLVCYNWTQRKQLCEVCLSKHNHSALFENALREWEANRSWTTPMRYTPYLERVRDLVRDLPVSKKRKTEFVKVMSKAYGEERRKYETRSND